MTDKIKISKKCKVHEWVLSKNLEIECKVCLKSGKITNPPIVTLSLGVGVQTCYELFKNWQNYDIVIHSDVSNGDREHGEYEITYWILDNLVIPFCKEKNIPLWILEHPKGGVYHRSLDEKKIPMKHPRWCTQDHKVDLMTHAIRKGLQAHYPDNVVISNIGFSHDEYWRADGKGSKVKYNVLDYPLVNKRVTRNDCLSWLNENYPIVMNGNKIDWKEAKSGCWFCPFWKKSKLLQLPKNKQLEMIAMEENSAYNKTFKNKPLKIVLGLDSHKMTEWTEEDEANDADACDSGRCFL